MVLLQIICTAHITDWIIAVSSSVTAISIIIIIFNYHLSRKAIREDHERSRREKAVNLILEWAKNLDEKSSITRRFAGLLSEEQLRCISKHEAFDIPSTPELNKKLLAAALGKKSNELVVKNSHLLIDEGESSKIRWILVGYLNNLEAIIAAWAYKIADEHLIESEFSYLFKGSDSGKALKKFRQLLGVSNFPALELFEYKMCEKTKDQLQSKYNLG